MNPTAALMLTQALEEDRRREQKRRHHRHLPAERMDRSEKRRFRLTFLRLPRFGVAGTKP